MLSPRFLVIAFSFFLFIFCSQVRAEPHLAFQGPPHLPQKKKLHAIPSSISQSVKPLVILDAGHGGSDEGARVRSLMEKRITLSTVLMTKRYLEEMGYRVILTRSKDTFVSLPRRCSIANKCKGAIFVSVHYNASKNKEASGIEIFYCDTKEHWRTHASKRLANNILYYLIDETGAHSRGVKKGNFHVIRETSMPAVLIEGGFVTNQEESSLLRDKAYLDKIAKGIAEGINKFLK